jgi:hypothetical protein
MNIRLFFLTQKDTENINKKKKTNERKLDYRGYLPIKLLTELII